MLLSNELVVNVGNIDDPRDFISTIREIALDGIKDDRPDHVANMAFLINGWTAEIDTNLSRHNGLKRLFLLGESVIDAEGHGDFRLQILVCRLAGHLSFVICHLLIASSNNAIHWAMIASSRPI